MLCVCVDWVGGLVGPGTQQQHPASCRPDRLQARGVRPAPPRICPFDRRCTARAGHKRTLRPQLTWSSPARARCCTASRSCGLQRRVSQRSSASSRVGGMRSNFQALLPACSVMQWPPAAPERRKLTAHQGGHKVAVAAKGQHRGTGSGPLRGQTPACWQQAGRASRAGPPVVADDQVGAAAHLS